MNIEAIGFRVLVKPDPVKEQTQGGIIIATNKQLERNATTTGVVINIGPEAFRSYNRTAGFTSYVPWVQPGDRVSYAKYAGKWIDDGEESFLVLNDEDICARIKDDSPVNVEA